MAAPGPSGQHPGVPGQITGPGPMPIPPGMHPQTSVMGPSQPNPQPQQGQPQVPQSQMEIDPTAKIKMTLLPRLKESLVNLFKVAGQLFHQNASQDGTGMPLDINIEVGRFEKCLEEFYAICDQIEIYLRLAHEVLQQDKDSTRNTPNSIVPQKADASQTDTQPYSQYLSTVRAQISCAKDIRDLLHECLKNFPEHSHP